MCVLIARTKWLRAQERPLLAQQNHCAKEVGESPLAVILPDQLFQYGLGKPGQRG